MSVCLLAVGVLAFAALVGFGMGMALDWAVRLWEKVMKR